MTTLANLEKQIEQLTKKAAALRESERVAAVKSARELVSRFGLTAQDLGLAGAKGRRGAKVVRERKAAGVLKYRDPQSGKTWTGHGKPPKWIAGVADRGPFLIEGQGRAVAAGEASAVKVTEPNKNASPKKAAQVKPAASAKAASVAKTISRAKKTAKQPDTSAKRAGTSSRAGKSAAKKAAQPRTTDMVSEATAPAEAA